MKKIEYILLFLLIVTIVYTTILLHKDNELFNKIVADSIRGIELNTNMFLEKERSMLSDKDLKAFYLSTNRSVKIINEISSTKKIYKKFNLKYFEYVLEDMSTLNIEEAEEYFEILSYVDFQLKEIEKSSSFINHKNNIKKIYEINEKCKEFHQRQMTKK